MGQAVRKEGSMEDILASIRKIISSDGSNDKAEEKSSATQEVNALTAQPVSTPEPAQSAANPTQLNNASAAMATAQDNVQPISSATPSLAQLAQQVKSAEQTTPSVVAPATTAAPATPAVEVPQAVPSTSAKPIANPTSSGSFADFTKSLQMAKQASVKENPTSQPAPQPAITEPAIAQPVQESPQQAPKEEALDTPVEAPVEIKVEAAPVAPEVKAEEVVEPKIEVAPAVPEVNAPEIDESAPLNANAAPKIEVKPEAVSAETVIEQAVIEPVIQSAVEPVLKATDSIDQPTQTIVSEQTQSAVSTSMDRLKRSVENIESANVEALLRPMLKEWLDSNLPQMVEGMIEKEIARICQEAEKPE